MIKGINIRTTDFLPSVHVAFSLLRIQNFSPFVLPSFAIISACKFAPTHFVDGEY